MKPFDLEDRIEINNYKGDVININALNFEVLEVNNETFIGQSTGVITHIPNSTIFHYPLRNYNKAFKYLSVAEKDASSINEGLLADVYRKIGACYRFGRGTEVDQSLASYYTEQAAKYGDKGSLDAVKMLRR